MSRSHQEEERMEALQAAVAGLTEALAHWEAFRGADPTLPGVLGATLAGLSAVAAARIWWRRRHGADADFPLDR